MKWGLSYFNIAIIANFVSFYSCFYLFISFFVEENECETFCECFLFYLGCQCCKCKCCDECREKCSNCECCKDMHCCRNTNACDNMECEGIVFLILLVIAIIIVITIIVGIVFGTIFLANLCGKHLSRYIVLIVVSSINLVICIMCCLLIKEEEELVLYIIVGVSGTITLSNVLSMIISNINCCPENESEGLIDVKNENMITLRDDATFCPETPYYENNDGNISNKNSN